MQDRIETLKHELIALNTQHAAGAVPEVQYEQSKARLQAELLELVLQDQPAMSTAAPDAVDMPAPDPAPHYDKKPSFSLVASLFLTIVLVAGLGYGWKGSPGQTSAGPPGMNQDGTPESEEQRQRAAQINAMIERLSQITQENPKDPQAWTMLGRANSVMGQHVQALAAFEKALQLNKTDPDLMADYADSLAMNNKQNLSGEPMVWIERALKLDPNNIKALAMAGSHAYDQKDYAGAVKFWTRVVQIGPADNRMVQMVASSLADARQLAGLPAAKTAQAASPAQSQSGPAGTSVSGRVTLSSKLQNQVQPDDTVFIFARAAEGSRMPLAIVRTQVKNLPFTFTLDDSTAMSPANKLSGASQVIVGARISRSGQAMPQPGDLIGQTQAMAPGASGLQIEINEQVKP
jgi:cytochrome c-type biogenesis protein CcmH